MQKTKLRPLRLVRLDTDQPDNYALEIGSSDVNEKKNGAGKDAIYNGVQTIADKPEIMPSHVTETEQPRGEAQAQYLLKSTPRSYLFNQAYGLWFFISYFLLTVIITRKVSTDQYGIFAVALTAFNTILYIIALGLEDALTTYVPRLFAEYGQGAAAFLIRRLLALRFAVLALSVVVILFAIPALASLIALAPINGATDVAASLRDPILLGHIMPIVVYVVGSSIASLLTAICAALMRMRLVFVINSLTQMVTLALSFVVLQIGWGIDGVLWMLAIISLFNAAAFALWLAPLIFTGGAEYKQPFKPVIQLGLSAWLTNLASGALLKQISIILLGVFAVSLTQRGYFNLSFQLADAANTLLVAGFGGVGVSALAAAFVGKNYERLLRSWQTLIKVETLLAAPGLVFCLFNAANIAHALYGSSYDPVGPLLDIFLFFNILV
ncbi:MAG: hypothetical protein JOZ18_21410, partial [Chloroflexi bacterium]|nr:hypothetical protein [Chloroflexota bacterium]